MTQVFVYITLPDQTEPVTAARFTHTVLDGVARGELVYARTYRENPGAVPFDPVELGAVRASPYVTVRQEGVFGAIRDASPDAWGRLVIDRHLKASGGETDYLLQSPDDRAGALSFGLTPKPPPPVRAFNKTWDLERLQAAADAVVAQTPPLDPNVERLLLQGSLMGGARPKVVVEDDDTLWLAKFNRPDDHWNMARVEYATLRLAHECDIHVARTSLVRVGDRDVLLSKRFDRSKVEDSGYRRARLVSGLTLLRSDDSPQSRPQWSYITLAEELRRVCERGAQDARQLFRRMVFNALVSNVDDHPRNHAIIAPGKGWRLSPAYDITPAPLMAYERDLAMACGREGRAGTARNLLTECGRFDLAREEASMIIEAIETIVTTRWRPVFAEAGVSEPEMERLSRAFAPASFRGGEDTT